MVGTRSRQRARVFALKHFDAAAWARENAEPGGAQLPYALDALDGEQVELRWSDAVHRAPWTNSVLQRAIRPLERLATPFLDLFVSTREIAAADTVLAILESQANMLALLRALRVPPYTRPRLAVVSSWLADEASRFTRRRRALYREIYRTVDTLIYFSRNQTAIFREVIGIPDERLAYVPFGIDHRYFTPRDVSDGAYLLAVGRDRGRDWTTLFEAVRTTDLKLKVACRPRELRTNAIPANVEVLGMVDRARYRELTAGATAVVIPTQVREYPTGQSVLLESMAMAKCSVVTDTPAIRDYVQDQKTAVLVPPRDPAALRDTLERVASDAALRTRLGTAARAAVEHEFNAERMWGRVADILCRPELG